MPFHDFCKYMYSVYICWSRALHHRHNNVHIMCTENKQKNNAGKKARGKINNKQIINNKTKHVLLFLFEKRKYIQFHMLNALS